MEKSIAQKQLVASLEKKARIAQRDYATACRELIRRVELEEAAAGDTRIAGNAVAGAATACATKKRDYDKISVKLRVARHG